MSLKSKIAFIKERDALNVEIQAYTSALTADGIMSRFTDYYKKRIAVLEAERTELEQANE